MEKCDLTSLVKLVEENKQTNKQYDRSANFDFYIFITNLTQQEKKVNEKQKRKSKLKSTTVDYQYYSNKVK